MLKKCCNCFISMILWFWDSSLLLHNFLYFYFSLFSCFFIIFFRTLLWSCLFSFFFSLFFCDSWSINNSLFLWSQLFLLWKHKFSPWFLCICSSSRLFIFPWFFNCFFSIFFCCISNKSNRIRCKYGSKPIKIVSFLRFYFCIWPFS